MISHVGVITDDISWHIECLSSGPISGEYHWGRQIRVRQDGGLLSVWLPMGLACGYHGVGDYLITFCDMSVWVLASHGQGLVRFPRSGLDTFAFVH